MTRRGYSLIEMIVVLTVGAVIAGVGVGVLYTMTRAEQTGRDRASTNGVFARLAEQFREDVAAAVRQNPEAAPGEWQFVLPDDQLVSYRVLSDEIEWNQIKAGKVVRQESFALPSGWSVAIAVQGDATPPTASLVITKVAASRSAGRELRVIAVLGKNHRYRKTSAGGDEHGTPY